MPTGGTPVLQKTVEPTAVTQHFLIMAPTQVREPTMRLRITILLLSLSCVGCEPAPKRAAVPEKIERVTILVMLPAYGMTEQIRAGNMGHAAIEFHGRLHDIGSLNGYAFTFRASTGVRFWPFDNADAALAAVSNHFDCDRYRDSITRCDVIVTPAQADALEKWWGDLEARMADTNNRLYIWNGIQCASAVVRSLNAAQIVQSPATTPAELDELLRTQLMNTAGPLRRKPAHTWTVQSAINPKKPPSSPSPLLHLPGMLNAGERSELNVADPDGLVRPVLWSDGEAYRNAVQSLMIQPGQVVPLAEKFDRKGVRAAGVQCVPNFLIGRWYHVESDHVIGQASLAGWYVNGDDGRVVFRTDPRVIRFDAFNGDRVVP
jgi:hypothetical protein